MANVRTIIVVWLSAIGLASAAVAALLAPRPRRGPHFNRRRLPSLSGPHWFNSHFRRNIPPVRCFRILRKVIGSLECPSQASRRREL